MLSFSFPQLLWLLPMLAAPVMLHLMKRSIAINITFPTIRFLTRGKLPKEGKRRLRDLLLLLLRLLFFAILILAVAGPKLSKEVAPKTINEKARLVTVAVDDSASMGSLGNYKKIFPVLEKIYKEDVSVKLVSFNEKVKIFPETLSSFDQALEAVKKIEPQPFANKTANFSKTVNSLTNEMIEGDLYIFSDFQKTGWETSELQLLPANIKLHLIDISKKLDENLAIMKAEIKPSKAGRSHISMQIHNFGATPVNSMITFIAGDIKEQKKISVPAGRTINSTLSVATPDTNSARLYLSNDKFDYDGQYHLWAGTPPPVEILVAAPLEKEPEKQLELFFLQKALAVPQPNAPRLINITPVDPELFELVDVASADAVILQGGAGYFKEEAFVVLKKFLENGGVVLATPGKTAANQFLGFRKHEILNARFSGLSRRTRVDAPFYADRLTKNRDFSKVFPEPEDTDIFQFPIRRYCRLQTFSPAEVLLYAENNDPLVTAQNVGKGRIFSFAFSLDNQWSDFPLTSSFLPIIKEIFNQENFSNSSGVIRVDSTVNHPVHKTKFQTPGVTTIQQRPYEINVSRNESITAKVNLTELRRALTGNLSQKTEKLSKIEEADATPLTPYLVALMAVLFILEMIFSFIADRKEFGRTINA